MPTRNYELERRLSEEHLDFVRKFQDSVYGRPRPRIVTYEDDHSVGSLLDAALAAKRPISSHE